MRFGVVGLGVMGRNHARVLAEMESVELVGAADPVAAGSDLRGLNIYRSLVPLINEGIDCAVVAVPTSEHFRVAKRLAEAGIHCLIEKPVANSVVQARRLALFFERSGVVGAVGQIERYNPAIVKLKEKMSAGEIGRVMQVQTRRQSSFPSRVSDVGCVKDLATHDIDIVRWITDSEYASVSAYASSSAGRNTEDLVVASGRLADGILFNHVVNWMSPVKERRVVVTGEHGTLLADTVSGDLVLQRNGNSQLEWDSFVNFRGVSEGDVTKFAFDRKEPLRAELEAFIRSVVSGPTDEIVSVGAGSKILEVAEAMLSSAADLRHVNLHFQ